MDTIAKSQPELFAGQEMGEDALRVLHESLKLRARILSDIAAELPHRSQVGKSPCKTHLQRLSQ